MRKASRSSYPREAGQNTHKTQHAYLERVFFKLGRRGDAHEVIGGTWDRGRRRERRRARVVCVERVDGRRGRSGLHRVGGRGCDGGRLVPSAVGMVSKFLCAPLVSTHGATRGRDAPRGKSGCRGSGRRWTRSARPGRCGSSESRGGGGV